MAENGVLEELEKERTRTISDRQTLKPFPILSPPPQSAGIAEKLPRRYDIEGWIAVFVFGNKMDSEGRILNSDGMLEKFKIAHANGLIVVPVGSTVHVAKQIHEIVSTDLRKYFPEVSG